VEILGQGNNNIRTIIFIESIITNTVFSLPATSYEQQILPWISDKDNSKAKRTVPLNDALRYCSLCSFICPRGTENHTTKSH